MSSLDFGLLTPYARDINVGTEAGAKAYSRGSLAGSIEKKDRTKLTVQSAEKVRDQIKHVETTFSWNILTKFLKKWKIFKLQLVLWPQHTFLTPPPGWWW